MVLTACFIVSTLFLGTYAQAANAIASPSWISADEYQIFEGDILYSSDNWNNVLLLRKQVESATLKEVKDLYYRIQWVLPSTDSPATAFEGAMLYEGLIQKGLYLYEGMAHLESVMTKYMKQCIENQKADGKTATYLSATWRWRSAAYSAKNSVERDNAEGKIKTINELCRKVFWDASWKDFLSDPQFRPCL
jgi:hypothetical protein